LGSRLLAFVGAEDAEALSPTTASGAATETASQGQTVNPDDVDVASLVGLDPARYLVVDGVKVTLRSTAKRLDADQRRALEYVASDLSERLAGGLITVSPDLGLVEVTTKGRNAFAALITDRSEGCEEVTSVSATWASTTIEIAQNCVPAAATAYAGSGGVYSTAAVFGINWGCALSWAGLAAAAVGVGATIALTPVATTAYYWALGTGVVGGFVSWAGVADNCTGVLAGNQKAFNKFYACSFNGYSNYVYDYIAQQNVPKKTNRRCNAGL
jgi:hypothetical protein